MDEKTELRMLQAASRASRTGAWRWYIGENRVIWSDVTHELFGVPRDTPIDFELGTALYDAESRTRLMAAIQACQTEGRAYDLVARCRTLNGRWFWARAIGVAVRDAAGRIVALEGSFQDITTEHEAIAGFEAARDDLASVLDTMPDGFFLLDENWRFVFVNPGSEKMLQRAPASLLGCNVWEEFPEARGSRFEQVYSRVMDTGLPESFTAFFPPLATWFLVSAHRSRRGIAVHFRDVTAQMEERLELKRFHAAIEALDAGAVMLVPEAGGNLETWRPVYANPAALRAAGGAHDLDDVAALLSSLSFEPSADVLARRVLSGTPCTVNASRGAGAALRRFEIVAVPIAETRSDIPSHVVLLISDVTGARRLEEEQRRTERLALLGQMAGGVSHDFNNLLSAILGNVELIEITQDPIEVRELIDQARAAVRRGQILNESLLAFAGRSRLAPRTEDLGAFLRALAPLLQRTLTSRIALHIDIEPDLPPVLLDTAMAESCLLNLVINAREAIEAEGSVVIALRRSVGLPGTAGPCVRLSVSDTGCGIPAELHERVFEPFFSARGRAVSSGLGLSRVKGFAEQMGGFVTLDSMPGQGTEIAMHFPLAALDVAFERDAGSPARSAAPRRLRALVVDDTPMVAQVAARLLAAEGCTVTTAQSAEDARRTVERHEAFDLLLTDVVMPEESGVTLAHRLMAMIPNLRVILMSGFPAQEADIDLPAGVEFLQKPVSRADLVAAMTRLGLDGAPDLPVTPAERPAAGTA